MLRLSCCHLCASVKISGQRTFTTTPLKWKTWSTSQRSVAKPATEEEQLPEQLDLSALKSADNFSTPSTNADSFPQDVNAGNFNFPRRSSQDISIMPSISTSAVKNEESPLPYFPTTVAETILSVKSPYNSPLRLINVADPTILDKAVKLDATNLLKCYLGLSKSRLTGLVVVTAMAGYALAPAPFTLGSFLSLSLGTALTSASANTVNQIVEIPYDSQMDRTKNRVLVKQKLSKEHAAAFAAISGVSGLTLLTLGANGLTAALGGLNLLLYTCVYTPMKRQSIANTWIGSVVGGIPPLMGWAACTGEITHGALLLGGILYAWQFPHFNALSWNLRNDYNKAGYKMMAISHPELCRKTSLRYSLSLILISSLAPVCNVTSWTFVIDSLPLNGYLAYLAYKFYQEGDSASSRKLFRFSLIHLPTLILLMMVSKQAYKDKTKECPITAAINDTTGSSAALSPPSPPVVFASINNNDVTISKSHDMVCNNDHPKLETNVNNRPVLNSVNEVLTPTKV